MALAIGLVAALASTASAQRQRGGQGRGGFGGGFGGGGVGFLISNEAVQKELKLDKDQVDKATEEVKKVREKHADDFTKLRDVPQEERRAKMQELTKEVNDETLKGVSEVLKPEQLTRLKQIELQRASFAAFSRADVQEALKLTTEQKEKVKTISDEANKDIQTLRGAGGQGRGQGGGAGGAGGRGRGQGGFGANNEKVTALRKETNEKLVALLNDDQKKTWKGMTGDAFEVPFTRPAPKKDD
jgi:hypothetical protein